MLFGYDANGRQNYSAQLNGSGPSNAIYDGAGQRVADKVAGSLNIMVYDAGGKLAAEYAQVTAPTSARIQYITANYQGSTSTVTDNAGSVTSRSDYLPFGEEIGAGVGSRTTGKAFGGDDLARQKYAGMETDDATGMNHTLWRKDDNLSGRWTSPDPLTASMSTTDPQSFNRYAYVDNDPVNHADSSGLYAEASQGSYSGNWGGDPGLNDPHYGGPGIIAEQEASRADAVADTCFANYLNAQGRSGKMTRQQAADAIKGHSGLQLDLRSRLALTSQFFSNAARSATSTEPNVGITFDFPGGPFAGVSFDQLWDGHVGAAYILKDAKGKPLFQNQCAIRESDAFSKAGVGWKTTYKGARYQGYALRCYELAAWITENLGPGETYSPTPGETNVAEHFRGRTGIIVFRDFWGNSQGHIDLFDGRIMQLKDGVVSGEQSYFDRSKSITFWDMPTVSH